MEKLDLSGSTRPIAFKQNQYLSLSHTLFHHVVIPGFSEHYLV